MRYRRPLGAASAVAVCVAMYGHDVPAFAQKPTAQSGRPAPAAPTPALKRQVSVASVPAPDAALLDKYCVSCHNDRLKTAGLSLQGLEFTDVPAHAQVWEKVMRKVRSGEMPPVTSRARLDLPTAATLVSYLETTLDRDAAAHPNPGRAPAHRLNRAEYSNAIRDLLAVDVTPGDWLPVDDSGYGFDNIAAVLSTSPALLERYMMAARRVSRLAVGDLTLKPVQDIIDAKNDPFQGSRNEQLSDDLPFDSRAGISVRYYFPVDAEYLFRIRFLGMLTPRRRRHGSVPDSSPRERRAAYRWRNVSARKPQNRKRSPGRRTRWRRGGQS